MKTAKEGRRSRLKAGQERRDSRADPIRTRELIRHTAVPDPSSRTCRVQELQVIVRLALSQQHYSRSAAASQLQAAARVNLQRGRTAAGAHAQISCPPRGARPTMPTEAAGEMSSFAKTT